MPPGFLAKKIVGFFCSPLNFAVLLIVISWILALTHARVARFWRAAAMGVIIFFSLRLPADIALRFLEHRFAPLEAAERTGVRWIVVLGGGHRDGKTLPAINRLSPPTLARLTEGIRLHRLLPESRLLLSGGTVFRSGAVARVMEAAALELGVPGEKLVVEDQSRDTADEARLIKAIVGTEPILLVTSAVHMKRAMTLFMDAGVDAQAAPAEYLSKPQLALEFSSFLPSADNLTKWDAALHEYFGLGWAYLSRIAR